MNRISIFEIDHYKWLWLKRMALKREVSLSNFATDSLCIYRESGRQFC